MCLVLVVRRRREEAVRGSCSRKHDINVLFVVFSFFLCSGLLGRERNTRRQEFSLFRGSQHEKAM